MSDSDRVAGETRLPAARTERVQPEEGAGSKLGAPVSLSEVLRGITPALAGETRRMQENLERRAADQELRDELASCDFDGKRYQKFEEEGLGPQWNRFGRQRAERRRVTARNGSDVGRWTGATAYRHRVLDSSGVAGRAVIVMSAR